MHEETLAVPDQMLPRRGPNYALKVQGTSMIDEHIVDGDIVVVHGKQTAENGEMVIALVNGSEATVKKFYREPGGWIRLQPANATMQPMRFQERDVLIQGVVVGGHPQVLSAWRRLPEPRQYPGRGPACSELFAAPYRLLQRPAVGRHIQRRGGIQQHGTTYHPVCVAGEEPLHTGCILFRLSAGQSLQIAAFQTVAGRVELPPLHFPCPSPPQTSGRARCG